MFDVYMKPFGPSNQWGGKRWQPEKITGVDADGNIWALCIDSLVPFVDGAPPPLRWVKFEAEVGE
jgi:hypothetical protein